MRTKCGDVVLVQFPRSDLRRWDRRPALVVQADGLATGLPVPAPIRQAESLDAAIASGAISNPML